jgi:Domain of unknown function (DUF4136)
LICVVIAQQTILNERTLDTFYDGYGGGWGWRRFGGGGFGYATTTAEYFQVGTLIVDLYDTKTKNLIWKASASDTLSGNSDKNIKNLDKSVEKMFKQLPPDPSRQ